MPLIQALSVLAVAVLRLRRPLRRRQAGENEHRTMNAGPLWVKLKATPALGCLHSVVTLGRLCPWREIRQFSTSPSGRECEAMATISSTQTREMLDQILGERILVIDGAMGTMVHALKFNEADFRGSQFARHSKDLKKFFVFFVF